MPRIITNLAYASFQPNLYELATEIEDKSYVSFCGRNNSGKSVMLKALCESYGEEVGLLPVSRFVSSVNLNPNPSSPGPLGARGSNFYLREGANIDGVHFDLGNFIRNMNDESRNLAFRACEYLLGYSFEIKKEDAANILSDNIIFVDGKKIDQASTGTRLIARMVFEISDTRIKRVAIDEPELGLSPETQQRFFCLISSKTIREQYFPHIASVWVATHSHLFLDRKILSNNFKIERSENVITASAISTIQDFQVIQFNLLGNSLQNIWLPELIVIVEGKTDILFIQKVIQFEFSHYKILVVEAQGDVVARVRELHNLLGGLHQTPYSNRTIVVQDSVHNRSNSQAMIQLGVSSENIIIWSKNGIEYFYPRKFMCERFLCSEDEIVEINITNSDIVEKNGVVVRKKDLVVEAIGNVLTSEDIHAEIREKLINRIKSILE